MIYKLQNGGVIKLQKAGLVPKIKTLLQKAAKTEPKILDQNLKGTPKTIQYVPRVTVSEPYARLSRDGKIVNEARSFSIDGDPFNTFQLIKDIEPNQYSIHFKTLGRYALSEPQKQMLFQAVADAIPGGSTLSTWGSVSKGGLAGLKRFEGLGFKPTLQTRTLGLKMQPTVGEVFPFGELIADKIEVPILYKQREVVTGSKPISFEEKLGWTKGERNQPVKQGIKSNPRYFLDSEELFPRDLVEIVPDDALVPNVYKQYMLSHKSDKHRGFDIYGWLEELPADHETVINNINDFAKTLPDYDPRFARKDGNPSFYITQFRDYLSFLGYDTSDISDESVLKLLTHQYKDLSSGATGKLKGRLVFHGTDKPFESFDYRFTGKNTGNMGYNGSGNYFTTHPSAYGSKTVSGFFGPKYRPGWQQPYMITGIKATPLNDGKLSPKLNIPDYISPQHGGDYKSVIDRTIRMADTGAVKDMAVIDDISHYPIQLFTEEVPISEFSVARNTGIKSLFPHPSRFIRNEDGTVRLIPTDWSDIRVNYKQGGKI